MCTQHNVPLRCIRSILLVWPLCEYESRQDATAATLHCCRVPLSHATQRSLMWRTNSFCLHKTTSTWHHHTRHRWHCDCLVTTRQAGYDKSQTSTEWVSSVLRPHQHSIGYMGDGFYRSKDPTNSIKVLKEMLQKRKKTTKTTKYRYT